MNIDYKVPKEKRDFSNVESDIIDDYIKKYENRKKVKIERTGNRKLYKVIIDKIPVGEIELADIMQYVDKRKWIE